jgi:hypothetical protein
MTIELSAASPETLNTPELNVAVVAALAGGLATTIAAAPSTTPQSSRRVARRQSLLRVFFIVPPLGAAGGAVACGLSIARLVQEVDGDEGVAHDDPFKSGRCPWGPCAACRAGSMPAMPPITGWM